MPRARVAESTPSRILPAHGHAAIRQETRAFGQLDCFGSFGGPEFLVDVLDVRLHGGTRDAELAADAGERLIRGEERQDAGLGWRQRNSVAGLVLVRRLRLAGDGAVTVRRGRSIRYRPIWLISLCRAPSSSGTRDRRRCPAVFVSYDHRRPSSPATPRSTRAGACGSGRRRLTVALAERGRGAIAPQPSAPVRRAADIAAFPTALCGFSRIPRPSRPGTVEAVHIWAARSGISRCGGPALLSVR